MVRSAVFTLAKVNDIHKQVLQQGNRYFIIRMISQSKGHTRSVAEADRAIRVAILQRRIAEREKEMEATLRKTIPVTIDEDALAAVKLPDALNKYKPVLDSASPPAGAPASEPAPAP